MGKGGNPFESLQNRTERNCLYCLFWLSTRDEPTRLVVRLWPGFFSLFWARHMARSDNAGLPLSHFTNLSSSTSRIDWHPRQTQFNLIFYPFFVGKTQTLISFAVEKTRLECERTWTITITRSYFVSFFEMSTSTTSKCLPWNQIRSSHFFKEMTCQWNGTLLEWDGWQTRFTCSDIFTREDENSAQDFRTFYRLLDLFQVRIHVFSPYQLLPSGPDRDRKRCKKWTDCVGQVRPSRRHSRGSHFQMPGPGGCDFLRVLGGVGL